MKQASGRTAPGGRIIAQPNYPLAESLIQEAINFREAALALDPAKADPAWITDQAENKGVSSEDLLTFFRHYLTIP